jgi:hypothetical protein
MARMGLAPIHQRPRTSVPHPEHRVFPNLPRDLTIDRSNQVWCADLTYVISASLIIQQRRIRSPEPVHHPNALAGTFSIRLPARLLISTL